MNRRASTASEAGSVVTLASELPEPLSNTPNSSQIPSALPGPTALLNNMNPPLNVPGSRRSSFSSAAANSPLLGATTGVRAGRSPSPAPLPAIRPSGTLPLTTQIINQKLYRDELATNFFRRLTFAPDGSLLLTPAGQIEDSYYPMPLMGDGDRIPGPKGGDGKAGEASKSTVYIYSRANLSRPPIAHLPGHQSTTVAVKFSPIFYELRNVIGPPSEPRKIIIDKKNPDVHVSLSMPPPPPPSSTDPITKEKIGAAPASMFALPYRLMYAVAAQDSVLLYDTQQTGPLAIFKGLHYSAFTDVAWYVVSLRKNSSA
jgi:chromatin assembly factor 1 subunit B